MLDRDLAGGDLHHQNLELRRKVAGLERRLQELSALHRVLLAIHAAPDRQATANAAVEQLRLSAPLSAGSIYQLDRDLAWAIAGWGPAANNERVFTPSGCLAVRTGKPHLHHPQAGRPRCDHVRSEGLGYGCWPIASQDRVLGSLHLRLGAEDAAEVAGPIADYLGRRWGELLREAEMQAQAIRDPLTQLYNRRFMVEALDREIERAKRGSAPVAVLICDVDRFKAFNDRRGHLEGDALLRSLSALLAGFVRAGDIACRYGGEEFVLVLPGTALADAGRRAEQLRAQVKGAGLAALKITVSIGVAAGSEQGVTAEALLSSADAALYQAKRAGRDRVQVFAGREPGAISAPTPG
jgi:diguanylate cyclase (GGDEF)-like protein